MTSYGITNTHIYSLLYHDTNYCVKLLNTAVDVDGYLATDETYRRYLRARHGEISKAEKMLKDSMSWR